MRISVGPAPSHWGAEKLLKLYRELAGAPVDDVYLGETACAGRSCLSPELAAGICDDLERAGKRVFASSLVLVREEAERRDFGRLARSFKRVEINSPALLPLARRYHAIGGMFLNVYNAASARVLARHRIDGIVLPCELDLASAAAVAGASPIATEMLVHGHAPIAISWACNTLGAAAGPSGRCPRPCRRYPEGILLEAGQQPLFRVDGPQTLSGPTYCLVEYLSELAQAGVQTVRVLPHPCHTMRIVRLYRDVLDGRVRPPDARRELAGLSPAGLCNGWLLGKAGWMYESPN